MDLTVYRHNSQHPFHIEISLDASDFVRKIESSHDVEERVRTAQADGACLLEVVALGAPKVEVLRELVDKVSSARDVADLLGVDRFNGKAFENFIAKGDYDSAARYAGMADIVTTKLRSRRDAKAVTVRNKIEEALSDLSYKAHDKLVDLADRMLNQIQSNAVNKRQEYQAYVMRQITSNGDQFERTHAAEIIDLRERIAGYEAMLKEAKDKVRTFKNKEVVSFARNDGTFGPDSPVAPSVLAKVQEKAQNNDFFQDSLFGLGS
jgi:hypothetical protein